MFRDMTWFDKLIPISMKVSPLHYLRAQLLSLLIASTLLVLCCLTIMEAAITPDWYSYAIRSFTLFLLGMSLIVLIMAENYLVASLLFLGAVAMELFPAIALRNSPIYLNQYWYGVYPLLAYILLDTRVARWISSLSLVCLALLTWRNFDLIAQGAVEVSLTSDALFVEHLIRYLAYFLIAVAYLFSLGGAQKSSRVHFIWALVIQVLLMVSCMLDPNNWSPGIYLSLLVPFVFLRSLDFWNLLALYLMPLLILYGFYLQMDFSKFAYHYPFSIFWFQGILALILIIAGFILGHKFNLLAQQADIDNHGANVSSN